MNHADINRQILDQLGIADEGIMRCTVVLRPGMWPTAHITKHLRYASNDTGKFSYQLKPEPINPTIITDLPPFDLNQACEQALARCRAQIDESVMRHKRIMSGKGLEITLENSSLYAWDGIQKAFEKAKRKLFHGAI